MKIKSFCNQIRNFFEMHSAARIVLYIAAMIQPAVNLLFFSSFPDTAMYCLWIGFYSCLLLGITLPLASNSIEQIFSIVLIIINLIPIGILFLGSLMLFPIGPILAFIYLWIPRIPFVSLEVSIGIFVVALFAFLAFIGRKNVEGQTEDEEQL